MKYREVFQFHEIFETFTYPAGEPHVRMKEVAHFLIEPEMDTYIIAEARNWNDLMVTRIANQILLSNGLTAKFVVPYLPFSRHDRKNDEYDSCPILQVFTIMTGCPIITIDPHSDVSGAFPHFPQSEVVKSFAAEGLFDGNPVIAIPDAGATKKAYTWLNGMDSVQCLKRRDPKTGKLSGFKVIGEELVHGRDVVIVDDICDGGGTFIGLAKELQKAEAKSLKLAVTHGLFTQGMYNLCGHFNHIYTLDLYPDLGFPPLIRISTEELIREGSYF